jgi:hypothetical protein
MSTPGTSTPAGWYPDPHDVTRGRYWDGYAWTDLYHTPGQPFPAGAAPKAPPGTDWNTPWIWLIVLLPVLPLVLMLFIPWGSAFDVDLANPYTSMSGTLGLVLSPFYWSSILLSYAVYGFSVFFAYRDMKELNVRSTGRSRSSTAPSTRSAGRWSWRGVPVRGTRRSGPRSAFCCSASS